MLLDAQRSRFCAGETASCCATGRPCPCVAGDTPRTSGWVPDAWPPSTCECGPDGGAGGGEAPAVDCGCPLCGSWKRAVYELTGHNRTALYSHRFEVFGIMREALGAASPGWLAGDSLVVGDTSDGCPGDGRPGAAEATPSPGPAPACPSGCCDTSGFEGPYGYTCDEWISPAGVSECTASSGLIISNYSDCPPGSNATLAHGTVVQHQLGYGHYTFPCADEFGMACEVSKYI